MSDHHGVLIIGEDAVLKGEVRNAKRVEVRGTLDGGVAADRVIVHEHGRLAGHMKSESAEVSGTVTGDIRVNHLIAIKSTGSVSGNVKYGRLAMDEGANLAAQVRNVPPSIAGDLDLTVSKGRSVRITTADLSAIDPDDAPENLTFKVSNALGGHLSRAQAPRIAIDSFTQAELAGGQVHFTHDGTDAPSASFAVVVADDDGATSGDPQTVKVAVRI